MTPARRVQLSRKPNPAAKPRLCQRVPRAFPKRTTDTWAYVAEFCELNGLINCHV